MEATTPRTAVDSTTPAPPGSQPAKDKVLLSPLAYAFQMLLRPLAKSLDRIEKKLASNGTAAPPPPLSQAGDMIPEPLDESALAPLAQRLEQLATELTDFRREALALLQSHPVETSIPEIVAAEVMPSDATLPDRFGDGEHDSWEEIILGSELSGDAALNAVRQQFLNDVVSGVIPARALAGQLLLLQTTPADELPERFRHVGEAYYRWRPRDSNAADPLEQALANWLTRRADYAGLHNSIQLVRPGDRFDSTRHSATTRGVEVVAVHGWVVLRDNTKVYTKASVTVQ